MIDSISIHPGPESEPSNREIAINAGFWGGLATFTLLPIDALPGPLSVLPLIGLLAMIVSAGWIYKALTRVSLLLSTRNYSEGWI